jgi:hypothetical protein
MADSVSQATGARLTDHLSIGVLTRTVPRFVIDEVLAETGRKEKRSRLLPAHVVVYFVMALALFRDGYEEVMRALVHGLRFARTWSQAWQVPFTGAISQAKVRLGEAPLKELFGRVARPLASQGTPGAWLGPWRLLAIDDRWPGLGALRAWSQHVARRRYDRGWLCHHGPPRLPPGEPQYPGAEHRRPDACRRRAAEGWPTSQGVTEGRGSEGSLRNAGARAAPGTDERLP